MANYFIFYLLKKEKTKQKNELDIYLVLTDLKKLFPDKETIIGIKHVNTGYTDFNRNIIFIWRYEEFEKVLIHEIQHYYGCDFHSSDPNYYLIKNVIEKHFDIDGDDKVNESYNEALAHIIAMVYFSKIHKIQLQDVYHHELYFLINI